MSLNKISISAFLFMGAAIGSSFSATVDEPFEVATWGNFCKAAVTHTFDDNTRGQTTVAQPIFDAKGFHMTLFTVTNSMNPLWSNLKNAFAKGHEIGSHSVSHPQTMSDAECPTSQKTIQQQVPGEKCVTIAYPNCNIPTPQTELKRCYIAGRICDGQIVNKTPSDFYSIGSIIIGVDGRNTASALNSKVDEAANKNGWCVFLHHGVGNDGHGYANTPTDVLQGNINYLYNNSGKFWTESFGNVVRYIKERDAVSLKVKSSDNNSITISITDNLPDSIFNFPLSIRRPLPDGWTDPVVTQNGNVIKYSIVTVNSTKYIMFNAVPDGGDIVLRRQAVAALKNESSTNFNSSAVVKLKKSLFIDRQQFNNAELSVSVFNLSGKTLAHYNLPRSKSSIELPVDKINQSAFVVKITGDGKTFTKTFFAQM